MARGQRISIQCPSCRQYGLIAPTGELPKKRRYVHGKHTGLRDSTHVFHVECCGCLHQWYSRHPDAERMYKRNHPEWSRYEH